MIGQISWKMHIRGKREFYDGGGGGNDMFICQIKTNEYLFASIFVTTIFYTNSNTKAGLKHDIFPPSLSPLSLLTNQP